MGARFQIPSICLWQLNVSDLPRDDDGVGFSINDLPCLGIMYTNHGCNFKPQQLTWHLSLCGPR